MHKHERPPIRAEPLSRNYRNNTTKQEFRKENIDYGVFTSAINILQTLVVAIGAGLAVWGVINLLEGYGNDNPGAKSQGIKQLMAGGGVVPDRY